MVKEGEKTPNNQPTKNLEKYFRYHHEKRLEKFLYARIL